MATAQYLYEHTNTEAIDSKLVYVTHSRYENDWLSLPHVHPFSELFYVKDGRGSFWIDEKEYPIQKNDFIIINANVTHTEKSSVDMPLEYITIGVENTRFSFQKDQEHIIFNCKKDQNDLLFYMLTMLREMADKPPDYEHVCQNLLEILIIQLIRRTNFAFEIEPSIQISRECLKLKRYIEANYMHEITLDSLAEISHMNKFYMVHAFTRYCGLSPISYLCQIRLRTCTELLVNTDYSITEIANSSGFSSQSYFAQCFQKNFGMTASAYRKAHKK